MLRALIELGRPKHWIKNVFVLMPVPFALASGAELSIGTFVLGLAGFCLANSAVYAFNDAYDAERDRAHPQKRLRPVASGRVSPGAARLASAALLAAALALVACTGHRPAIALVAVYALLNVVYCLGGKHVALLDVFLLSSGFVIRVLLGCALLAVTPSQWLLLCSSALALFLALAKRRADLVRGMDGAHRPSLEGYSIAYLDQALGITAALTLVGYSLYCMEAEVLLTGREFASVPFVFFGVLDYLRLAHLDGAGGSPVDVLLTSPAIAATGTGWMLATLWSVGIF